MTGWRFREISRNLHFVNNDNLAPRGDPLHDRLGKVRPLIDHLSSKFCSLYDPSKDVAVDEAMIKFQGRFGLKQYMPMKPIKRGIKVWVLGDSTNGYFSRFQVYTGRQENREVGLGAHVVKTLTKDLKNNYHHVYFDNFFTSVQYSVARATRGGGDLQLWHSTEGQKRISTSPKSSWMKERYDNFCTTYTSLDPTP